MSRLPQSPNAEPLFALQPPGTSAVKDKAAPRSSSHRKACALQSPSARVPRAPRKGCVGTNLQRRPQATEREGWDAGTSVGVHSTGSGASWPGYES